jgi:16S rRNA (adenine1518-N6/adenine1519-N6)-dimethyltransferase
VGDRAGIPASRHEVRALLDDLGLHPHKRFGQNFLADPGVLDRIVDRSGAGAGSVVLEVGPGLGTLTSRLLLRGASVIAAEIDRGLARRLREVFADDARFVLVEGDVLGARSRLSEAVAQAVRSALDGSDAGGFRVVSNLPYGISSAFLTSLAFDPGPPLLATVMLQAEVASLLRAAPRGEDYSALGVFVQTYFDVTRDFDVGRHAFFPEPDVDSTVVTLSPRGGSAPDPASFSVFVQALFQRRRKTLAASLGAMLATGAGAARARVAEAGFDPTARVEELSPARIADLFAAFGSAGPAS